MKIIGVTKHIKLIVALTGILFTAFLWSPAAFAQQAKTYDEAINMGDKYFKQGKLLDAKAYYQMALKFKKEDAYAKAKTEEIVKKLQQQFDNEEKYYDIIDRADDFFDNGALDAALTQYKEALKIIPGDDYATKQIAKINKIKKDEADKQAAFKKAMQQAAAFTEKRDYRSALEQLKKAAALYPGNGKVQDKIAETQRLLTQQKINKQKAGEEIQLANRYLLIKNYALALSHYRTADSLVPDNPDILLKIKEIEPKAKRQAKYDKLSQQADKLYMAKNYMAAKEKYAEAQKIWPENSYPKEMIARIDEMLNKQKMHLEENYKLALRHADSLFRLKEFDNSKAEYNMALTLKPDATYPKQKLKEIDDYYALQKKKLEQNYKGMLRSADSLLQNNRFDEAIEKYNLALEVKPGDPYPARQLKAARSAKEKYLEEEKANLKYNALIAEADRLYDNGQYDLAIAKYKEAQIVKSSEKYPEEKIQKIRKVLANLEHQRILDEKYGNQIILATRLAKEEKFEEAKKAFQNALTFKPDATLPMEKMAEMDSLIQDRKEKEHIKKLYTAAVKSGDSLLKQKKYETALEAYDKALQLKPDDTYALKQKQSVTQTLASIKKAEQLQKAYEEQIRNADQLLKDKKYELARVVYQKASSMKPDEKYPKEQITQIDKKLVQLQKEKEQRYLQAMTKAENLFGQKNYTEALMQYKTAASIKPEAKEPLSRIEECNTYINEQIKKLKTQYNLAVADADKFYAAKIYDRAIQAYRRAEKIKPDETYPEEMIAKITKYIEDNAVTDVIKSPVVIEKGKTEKVTFSPLPIKVRKSNYILVKAKNMTKEEFKVIFGYGSDKGGKNGGFVVTAPADGQEHDFIIRVGNQYKWFSEDNTWITIMPEGGSLEVSLLRISKSN